LCGSVVAAQGTAVLRREGPAAMGRRQFAKDSKNVRHFRLVSRSQNDRFADDPDAPPLVLEPYAPPGATRRTGLSEAELMQVPKSLEESIGPEVFGQPDDRDVDEKLAAACMRGDGGEDFDPDDLDGDCYFPRDGYNYEQHLKKVSGGKGAGGAVGVVIDAPVPVQKQQEQLNLQPPCSEEQKEALRALDNAEEYEELEDGTLEEMFEAGLAEDQDLMLWGPTAAENQDLPDLALFKAMREQIEEYEDSEEGTARQEVLAGRQANTAVSDADFDQFLAAEYGDEEIGACDEEIEGNMSLERCEAVLDEYNHMKQQEAEKMHSMFEPIKGKKDDVPRVIDETRAIIEKYYSKEIEGEEEDTSSGEDSEDESRTWDCETVLSTLSNLSNRPGKIGRIKVVKKPAPALKAVKEDDRAEEGGKEGDDSEESDGVVELPDVITTRPRGETPEERRARKASVKEMRRMCRKMKKDSKDMYKTEASKLPVQTGPDVRGKARCHRL